MSTLLGYALVNNCIPTPLTSHARAVLAELQSSGQLDSAARVALCSQLCLAEAHQGHGLMPALLAQLLRQLASRYDYLHAIVHHLNERSLRFHLRQGYQLIRTDAERFTLLKSTAPSQPLVPLPHGLSVHPGTSVHAQAAHALNQQWLRTVRADLANGFLTTTYSVAEFQILCATGEMAVLSQ
jgi:hypothetical protein